jgi:hypothetical protein
VTADLVRLWAERDEAKARWQAFMEEADAFTVETDPVLVALYTGTDERTDEQQELIRAHQERQHTLLDAVLEAERKVRVASGHEKP